MFLQGPEHPNPGQCYNSRGFPRFGYLPDNEIGQKVCRHCHKIENFCVHCLLEYLFFFRHQRALESRAYDGDMDVWCVSEG